MCLLHWLYGLQRERGLKLFAAHYEHGLRGEESLRDAEFVRDQCMRLGVPLVQGSGDVKAHADAEKIGIEEAARTLRYRFLDETADRLSCSRIATAHNADDNAETVLMNLCRGSGTRGLAGIPPRRGRLIRPLLLTGREEIEAYLQENGIPHVEDSSNASDSCTRNRIRHRILPLLREENPSFLNAVSRTAELLRADDDCLNRMARQFIDSCMEDRSLPSKALAGLEAPVAARVVRLLCGSGVSMERTRAVLRFAEGTEKGVLELPGGKKILRQNGRLHFPEERN